METILEYNGTQYSTTEEVRLGSCSGCAACNVNSALCESLSSQVSCSKNNIIFIKRETPSFEVKDVLKAVAIAFDLPNAASETSIEMVKDVMEKMKHPEYEKYIELKKIFE